MDKIDDMITIIRQCLRKFGGKWKKERVLSILRERVRNEKNFKFFIVFMIFKICMYWNRGIELYWNRVN